MQPDPFGNLKDWGPALALICQAADDGSLSECQPGLTRILAYKDNWRLREETLKRVGTIGNPSEALTLQVLNIISNRNLYYEVRILACESMVEWLKNNTALASAARASLAQAVTGLLATPQPPIFAEALQKLAGVMRERFGVSPRD